MTQQALVIGLGAIGALYARVLQQSGKVTVTAVARSNFTIIRDSGLDFRGPGLAHGELSGWRPDRLFSSITPEVLDRTYDFVLISSKCIPEVQTTPELVAPLLSEPYVSKHPQPTYVLLQNGLNVERDLHAALAGLDSSYHTGPPKLISAVLWVAINIVESNVVFQSLKEHLDVGVYRPNDFTSTSNTSDELAILSQFADAVKAGNSSITIVPEVQRIKFKKNIMNCALSASSALSGYTMHAMVRPRISADGTPSERPWLAEATRDHIEKYAQPTIRGLLEDVVAVGKAYGFPDQQPLPISGDGFTGDAQTVPIVEATWNLVMGAHAKPHGKEKASMLLDLETGRPIEVEVIVGEVVRMARAKGLDFPRLEMLYAMLLIKQNQLIANREERASQ